METSIKIMLSYDYNHFEVCISKECKTVKQVNELRKNVQRLADEAVRQYKKAKEMECNREQSEYLKKDYLREIERIQNKPEGERTINEVAKLKAYNDKDWESQFDFPYDYEDEIEDYDPTIPF